MISKLFCYNQINAQGPVIAQAFTSQHGTPQLNAESFSPADHSAIGPSSIISYYIYTPISIILVTIATLCSVR
jgi:hypothetical protein